MRITSPNKITGANAGRRPGFAGNSWVVLRHWPGVAQFHRSATSRMTIKSRSRIIGYSCVTLLAASLVWLGFHHRIISAWKTHRWVAALRPEHSHEYWSDRIAKVEVGMTLRHVVEILPPNSSIGSWARDDLGGQDSFYALDSTWAVSMLVDITAAEDNTLLRKPVLLRHHRAFNESGCVMDEGMTPP